MDTRGGIMAEGSGGAEVRQRGSASERGGGSDSVGGGGVRVRVFARTPNRLSCICISMVCRALVCCAVLPCVIAVHGQRTDGTVARGSVDSAAQRSTNDDDRSRCRASASCSRRHDSDALPHYPAAVAAVLLHTRRRRPCRPLPLACRHGWCSQRASESAVDWRSGGPLLCSRAAAAWPAACCDADADTIVTDGGSDGTREWR